MKISVIISTYNSPQWLEKVLWGYECQTRKGFEIVIADDGSGDETRKLIAQFLERGKLVIRHVWQDDRGFRKCAALNKAIMAASGDYLIFTDGDCVPAPDLVAVHAAKAETGKYLSGTYSKLSPTLSSKLDEADIASARCFTLPWLIARRSESLSLLAKIGARPLGLDPMLNALVPVKKTFNGNNSSCWKRDILAVGGFDERMGYGGEDREMGYRLANNGIAPKRIRYSARCLHLDHPRGYKNEAVRAANMKIIDETIKTGRVRTDFGISS